MRTLFVLLALILVLIPVFVDAADTVSVEDKEPGLLIKILREFSLKYRFEELKRSISEFVEILFMPFEIATASNYDGEAPLSSTQGLSVPEYDDNLLDSALASQGAHSLENDFTFKENAGLAALGVNVGAGLPGQQHYLARESRPDSSPAPVLRHMEGSELSSAGCSILQIKRRYVGGYLLIQGPQEVFLNQNPSLTAMPVINIQPIATVMCDDGKTREIPHGEEEILKGSPYAIAHNVKTDELGLYDNIIVSDRLGVAIERFSPGVVDDYLPLDDISGAYSYRVVSFAQRISQ